MPLDWPKCVAHALLTAEVRHAVSATSTAVSCWLWSSTPPPPCLRAPGRQCRQPNPALRLLAHCLPPPLMS